MCASLAIAIDIRWTCLRL